MEFTFDFGNLPEDCFEEAKEIIAAAKKAEAKNRNWFTVSGIISYDMKEALEASAYKVETHTMNDEGRSRTFTHIER